MEQELQSGDVYNFGGTTDCNPAKGWTAYLNIASVHLRKELDLTTA